MRPQFYWTIFLTASLLFGLERLAAQQEEAQHPILVAIEKNWIVTPSDQEERPTKVTILGTTCNAMALLTANIQYRNNPPGFFLEYTKYVTINTKGNPDACWELEAPDIDTTFDLTFVPSGKRDAISFTGQIQPGCKDCTPKRAKSIAGVLRKVRGGRYQLSFSGDLADAFELEEKH